MAGKRFGYLAQLLQLLMFVIVIAAAMGVAALLLNSLGLMTHNQAPGDFSGRAGELATPSPGA